MIVVIQQTIQAIIVLRFITCRTLEVGTKNEKKQIKVIYSEPTESCESPEYFQFLYWIIYPTTVCWLIVYPLLIYLGMRSYKEQHVDPEKKKKQKMVKAKLLLQFKRQENVPLSENMKRGTKTYEKWRLFCLEHDPKTAGKNMSVKEYERSKEKEFREQEEKVKLGQIMFGFLSMGYSPHYYWWEFTKIFLRLIILALYDLFVKQTRVKEILAGTVIFLYCGAVFRKKPYQNALRVKKKDLYKILNHGKKPRKAGKFVEESA
jgi:hypothetical protein